MPSSPRYANPETYLIPKATWPSLRPAICQELRTPENGAARLEERGRELNGLLPRVNRLIAGHRSVGERRMEKGRVVVPPLEAEEWPKVSPALNMQWHRVCPGSTYPTCSSKWIRGPISPKSSDLSMARNRVDPTCFPPSMLPCCRKAATLALLVWPRWPTSQPIVWPGAPPGTCERTLSRMPRRRWSTFTMASHSLTRGGGTPSSSDGQRIPVAGKIRNATALPRYFRYQGLTYYTWTSDQLSQYGTKVIPATVRDATYVLDAILDNETELTIVEHATDTAGYTDVVFALFDLLGMQFAPRLRDLGDQQLYRMSRDQSCLPLGAPVQKGRLSRTSS